MVAEAAEMKAARRAVVEERILMGLEKQKGGKSGLVGC